MPITIAPVGTCRIHNPFKTGRSRHPMTLVHGRNYGFVHTSAEVVQQLRFMFGMKDVPEHIRPVVFRPGLAERFLARRHSRADVYVVEISSRKELSADGHSVQLNYMGRHFADFFSDKERARTFWSLATSDQLTRRRGLLENDPAFLKLSVSDQDLLASIVRRDMSDVDIERDIDEMVELLGESRLVLVTHVDALKPDNTAIDSRSKLIALVKAIAERKGIPCYDPTRLMNAFGQINAMENDGLDLTHYTEAFYSPLCSDLFDRCIATSALLSTPIVNPLEPAKEQEEGVSAIEAMWLSGELVAASRRLHEILREDASRHEYRLLLGRMQYDLGDFASAISNTESAREALGHEEPDLLLMRAYFETGNYSAARDMASALISDELETAEVFRVSAVSASHLHDAAAALADWHRVYQVADDKTEAADAVLGILRANGDRAAIVAWAKKSLDELPFHVGSFSELWRVAVDREDRSGLLALANGDARLPQPCVVELATLAVERGFITPAAALIARHDLATAEVPDAEPWLAQRLDDWLAEGTVALAQGRMLVGSDRIQACWLISPEHTKVLRARRLLESTIRSKARDAFVARDLAEVVALGEITDVTLLASPDIDGYVGRAFFDLGDYGAACRCLRRAAGASEASTLAKVLYARAALRATQYAEAVDAYLDVLREPISEGWARKEAESQLHAVKGRLIRVARVLAADDQQEMAWQLLDRLKAIGIEGERVDHEKKRLMGAIHSRLRSLPSTQDEQRLALGELILRLNPSDLIGLKAVAVGAMRAQQFYRAMHCWMQIKDSGAANEQVEHNIRKCSLWIERLERKKGARKAA